MLNRKFMTENARITDAYAQMYARRGVNESSNDGNGNLLRSLRGQLPIDGTGSPRTGSKLGVRKVLQFEKRDDRPTSIGRISNVRNVSVVKGLKESIDDFEDIEDTETISCEGCDKRDEVLDLVLSTFEQIYDNLSDDDKETVDEVKVEIESVLNPEDDDEDEDDVDGDFEDEEEDIGESVVNEVGPAKPTPKLKSPSGKPPAGKPPAGKPPAGKPPAGKPPKKGGSKPSKPSKPKKTGNSAWDSIEDLPREKGMTDAEYAQRNTWHKIKEYASKNKVSFWEAGIALGIGAGILTAYGLMDGDENQPEKNDNNENPLDPKVQQGKKARDATKEDEESGIGRQTNPAGTKDEVEIYKTDEKGIPLNPEMQAKMREELNDRYEYQKWKAQRGSTSQGGGDGRGVIDQIADAPGKLIGGVLGGVAKGGEALLSAPSAIIKNTGRNIRATGYGLDDETGSEEYRLKMQREHEREMMKMKREEEQARWEAEQKRREQAEKLQQRQTATPSETQTYTVKDNLGGDNKIVQTSDSVTVTGPNWKKKPNDTEDTK